MIVGVDGRRVSVVVQLGHTLRTMNFYRTQQNTRTSAQFLSMDDLLILRRQQLASRYYIILLLLSIIIVLLFNGLRTQIYSVTIPFPTESMFDHLQAQYSSTLSCPCSHIAISYSQFLSVGLPVYHQICSSYFVSSNFTRLLWRTEDSFDYFWNIDSKILSTHFRFLSALCSMTKDIVYQKNESFILQELISLETLSRHSFQVQINSIITAFLGQTPGNFQRLHRYIIDMLHVNQLQNIFYTNWNMTVSDPKNNYIMSTYPIEYNGSDGFCSCATSSACSRSILMTENSVRKIPGKTSICFIHET